MNADRIEYNRNKITTDRLHFALSDVDLSFLTPRQLVALSSVYSRAEIVLDARSALLRVLVEARMRQDAFLSNLSDESELEGTVDEDETEFEWTRLALIDLAELKTLTGHIGMFGLLQCIALLARIEQVNRLRRENGGFLETAVREVFNEMT